MFWIWGLDPHREGDACGSAAGLRDEWTPVATTSWVPLACPGARIYRSAQREVVGEHRPAGCSLHQLLPGSCLQTVSASHSSRERRLDARADARSTPPEFGHLPSL